MPSRSMPWRRTPVRACPLRCARNRLILDVEHAVEVQQDGAEPGQPRPQATIHAMSRVEVTPIGRSVSGSTTSAWSRRARASSRRRRPGGRRDGPRAARSKAASRLSAPRPWPPATRQAMPGTSAIESTVALGTMPDAATASARYLPVRTSTPVGAASAGVGPTRRPLRASAKRSMSWQVTTAQAHFASPRTPPGGGRRRGPSFAHGRGPGISQGHPLPAVSRRRAPSATGNARILSAGRPLSVSVMSVSGRTSALRRRRRALHPERCSVQHGVLRRPLPVPS